MERGWDWHAVAFLFKFNSLQLGIYYKPWVYSRAVLLCETAVYLSNLPFQIASANVLNVHFILAQWYLLYMMLL